MTIKQLMNSANVTPDVVISINSYSQHGEIYWGRYDQASELTCSVEVDSFRVTHLRELEYRTDIDRMIIYVK